MDKAITRDVLASSQYHGGIRAKGVELCRASKVRQFKKFGAYLVGEVVSERDAGMFHTVSLCLDGTFTCTCHYSFFHTQTPCKHCIAVLLTAGDVRFVEAVMQGVDNLKMTEESLLFQTFPTSLEGVNHLFKGGFPVGCLNGIYGKFKAGKSILMQQMAWESMASLGGNAAIFDTEDDYLNADALPAWKVRFDKRFKLDVQIVKVVPEVVWSLQTKKPMSKMLGITLNFIPGQIEPDKQTLFIIDCNKFTTILALYGRPVSPTISETGKIEFRPMASDLYVFYAQQSLLGQFIQANDIKFLGFDSVTRLLSDFHGGRTNYPVKSAAEKLLFGQMAELAKYFKLLCLISHQQSKDPTNKYSRPNPTGGQAVGHYFKRMIHMNKYGTKTVRRLKVWRSPSEGEWDETTWQAEKYIVLSNIGFTDYEGKDLSFKKKGGIKE